MLISIVVLETLLGYSVSPHADASYYAICATIDFACLQAVSNISSRLAILYTASIFGNLIGFLLYWNYMEPLFYVILMHVILALKVYVAYDDSSRFNFGSSLCMDNILWRTCRSKSIGVFR